MQIINYGTSKTHEVNLRLKSIDRNMQWYIQPGYGLVPDDKNSVAHIVFDDSQEIDQLIDILQRFKEDTRRCLGGWR